MSPSEGRALLELNLRRETWCKVEADPRQSWERAERRHFRGHLRTSPVLLAALTAGQQCGGGCTKRLPPPPPRPPAAATAAKLPERSHFEESYKSHLV